jgi:SAM-dependent methyltransferase
MNLETNPCNSVTSPKLAPTNDAAVDFDAIKQRQQKTWESGDYAVIGTTLQIVGELLSEAADVRADDRVLDVAAGNGNASLAAARRFARVTAVDYVPHLLEKAADRAKAEGLAIDFRGADVEALPFEDQSFDVALSTFGAMFTPRHDRVAAELLRVVRGGGRIAMANWTPEGFIGQLLRLLTGYVAPPAGTRSPMLWGTEPHLVELFGAEATDIRCARRNFTFRYRSPSHWIEVFRNFYGPTHKAYATLAGADQARLTDELTELLEHLNVGGPQSLVIPGEYLEVVITK